MGEAHCFGGLDLGGVCLVRDADGDVHRWHFIICLQGCFLRIELLRLSISFNLEVIIMKKGLLLLALLGFGLVFSGCGSPDTLVIYSSRKAQLIQPVVDAYMAKTGINIEFLTDKAGPLLQRLKAEGADSRADVLITVDAGMLWKAAEMGLLQATDSSVLAANIPAQYRDTENRWFGLSLRARTIVYNTDTVEASRLSRYEDLASPKWKGRVCLRTSQKVYNQSLVAMMIHELGEDRTLNVVEGWVENLAAEPFTNDTKTLEAVASLQCEVGIVNSYYFGRLLKKSPDLPLKLYWPNQSSKSGYLDGVHVNVSGAGISKYAKNAEAARKFIEWLSGEEAQSIFADVNQEYPVNPSVAASDEVATWGTFKPNASNLNYSGELQVQAIQLMDKAGYR